MTRLTEPQTRALASIARHGPARPSNITAPGRIHSSLVDTLIALRYIAYEDHTRGARLVLTDQGQQAPDEDSA